MIILCIFYLRKIDLLHHAFHYTPSPRKVSSRYCFLPILVFTVTFYWYCQTYNLYDRYSWNYLMWFISVPNQACTVWHVFNTKKVSMRITNFSKFTDSTIYLYFELVLFNMELREVVTIVWFKFHPFQTNRPRTVIQQTILPIRINNIVFLNSLTRFMYFSLHPSITLVYQNLEERFSTFRWSFYSFISPHSSSHVTFGL